MTKTISLMLISGKTLLLGLGLEPTGFIILSLPS